MRVLFPQSSWGGGGEQKLRSPKRNVGKIRGAN